MYEYSLLLLYNFFYQTKLLCATFQSSASGWKIEFERKGIQKPQVPGFFSISISNYFFSLFIVLVFVQVDDISDQVRNKEEENRQLQEEMEDARLKQETKSIVMKCVKFT